MTHRGITLGLARSRWKPGPLGELSATLARMTGSSVSRVLGVCGSLRKASSNLALLQAAARLAADGIELILTASVERLPHFNPDLDVDPSLEAVSQWRAELAAASAVLICSPEYAFGVPGALKNALDWVVSSGELYDKPVGLITASPNDGGAAHAHAQLIETLCAHHASVIDGAHISVPFVRKRFDALGNLVDPDIERALRESLQALARAGRQQAEAG